jgi:hypothetical protein
MEIINSPQYKQLKEAMESLRKLKVPEHLQQQALGHLLQGVSSDSRTANSEIKSNANNLREFINSHNPKGAVAEIPALLYWLKINEQKLTANENDILELYRRANIRPPKNIAQSLRDLASKKKYGRLEAVNDQPGYVRLSRVGEDFVLYDLRK